jgi:hypothetical protein
MSARGLLSTVAIPHTPDCPKPSSKSKFVEIDIDRLAQKL